MEITFRPVAVVGNERKKPLDDQWGDVISEIQLEEHIPTEAFEGIENFSHLEIIYYFDKAKRENIIYAGHPRENPDYPLSGIFAQRKKDRPNPIGLCTVQLVERKGRTLRVKYLDAISGTPVLDIKPVFREFQPKGELKQPAWVSDLMKEYW
jgi:tRNA-Thr(GGU) m(6)t(6)A37 methyltransferase TsaA